MSTEPTDPKPIPTTYNGVLYRSRTEARWAFFLEHIEVRWSYESEGFELPSGRYLPDFWLPDTAGGCFVEIKPERAPTARERLMCAELSRASGRPVFMFCGSPRYTFPGKEIAQDRYDASAPGSINADPRTAIRFLAGAEREEDHDYQWCACACGRLGIEWRGRVDRVCPPDAGCFPSRDGGWSAVRARLRDAWERDREAPDADPWGEAARLLRNNALTHVGAAEQAQSWRFW